MTILPGIALQTLSNQRQLIFRLAAVLLVPFLAIVAGLLTAKVQPEIVVVAAAAPIGILIAYQFNDRFEYGIVGIVAAAGLVNFFALPTGTESRIVISMVLSMALLARWFVPTLLVDKRIQIKPSPINRPLLMFAAVNIASYLWGNAFRDPLLVSWRSFPVVQIAALVVNILLPILVLLVYNKLGEGIWLKWLTWLMLGMGALYLIAYFFAPFLLNYILSNGSSGLFPLWVMVLALSVALYDEKLPLWLRGLLLVLVLAFFYRTFFLGRLWLSGWIPAVGGCAVVTFLRSKKLFAVMMLVGLLYLGLNFDYYYQDIVVSNQEEGGEERLDLWRMNLEHVANHPLLGMGPAGYAVYNMTYHPWDARSTHNNYFDILAQTGVIGFGIFLWLFFTFARMGYQTCQRLAGQRTFEEAFASATLAGCAGALVAMMLGDWVLPFAYNGTIAAFDHASYTWIFLGGLVTLYHLVKARETVQGQAEAV
jgi:hypothetical protein